MEVPEQELRKLEKSTAEAHGSLSLGLFATALLPDALWQILSLVILGALFALSSIYIYLVLRFRWKRTKIFVKATKVRIRHVSWFLGFVALGIGLLQAGWGFWWGILSICIAYLILGFGTGAQIIRGIEKRRIKGRKTKEAKVGNNTQQQKDYSHKDIYTKLENIENKIESSGRTQKFVFLYTLGAAFVILGLSYWPGLLEHIGMDTTRFYLINPVALIVLGFIAMICARVFQRAKKK